MIPHDLRPDELGAYFIAMGKAMLHRELSPHGLADALRPGRRGRRALLVDMRDEVINRIEERWCAGMPPLRARADEILAMELWEAISLGPGDMKGCADI